MARAQNQAPAFFFAAALLLLAATAPPACAQLLTPIAPTGLLNVSGIFSCPGGGRPIPGVNVTMSCAIGGVGSGSGSIIVGQAITGINGGFTIVLNLLDLVNSLVGTTVPDVLNGKLPCVVIARLPANQLICSNLSGANGLLVGVLALVGNVVSGIGNIVSLSVSFAIPINFL